MCIHSDCMTEETCSICNVNTQESEEFDPAHSAPIYEGMTEIDNQAAKFGNRIRGFKFKNATRCGARGQRRGKAGAE